MATHLTLVNLEGARYRTIWPAFERLMRLMNELIKHYSMSDDYGEYSKKPELWAAISASPEIKSFLENPENLAVIERYTSIKG